MPNDANTLDEPRRAGPGPNPVLKTGVAASVRCLCGAGEAIQSAHSEAVFCEAHLCLWPRWLAGRRGKVAVWRPCFFFVTPHIQGPARGRGLGLEMRSSISLHFRSERPSTAMSTTVGPSRLWGAQGALLVAFNPPPAPTTFHSPPTQAQHQPNYTIPHLTTAPKELGPNLSVANICSPWSPAGATAEMNLKGAQQPPLDSFQLSKKISQLFIGQEV